MGLLEADIYLWRHLSERYHDQPLPRGYLDAGRLNQLFGWQILPAEPLTMIGPRTPDYRAIRLPITHWVIS